MADSSKPICGEPVALPITNFTVPGSISDLRGIPLRFGTPPQLIALDLEIYTNSTLIQRSSLNSKTCPLGNDPACIWRKGGLFNEEVSSTYKNLGQDEWGGERTDSFIANIEAHSQEVLTLPDERKLEHFPIGLENGATDGNTYRSVIGLARNSTIVNSLFQNKTIPSRVWGLDHGWTGGTLPTWRDGELVLGGYNKDRVKGDFFKFPFSPLNASGSRPCSYIAFVTQIRVVKPNGSAASLMKLEGESMKVCLEPSYPLITMPHRIFQSFNKEAGNVYIDKLRSYGDFYTWGYAIENSKHFKGELEFTFSNGFKTSIPNHQLIQPYRKLSDKTGQTYVESAGSVSVLKLNSLQEINEADLPLFGVPFFSSIYMAADLDNENFYLAQPSYTTRLSNNEYATLPGSTVSRCDDPAPPGDDDSQLPGPETMTKSSSTNVGAVAGGVVGGVLFLLLLCAVIFFCRRRRRNMKSFEPGLDRSQPFIGQNGMGYSFSATKTDYKGHYAPPPQSATAYGMFSPELDSTLVHEAPGMTPAHYTPNEPVEMDANPTPKASPGSKTFGSNNLNDPPQLAPPVPLAPNTHGGRTTLWSPDSLAVSALSSSPQSRTPVSGM